jgi:hypothetical protein
MKKVVRIIGIVTLCIELYPKLRKGNGMRNNYLGILRKSDRMRKEKNLGL